MNVAYVCVLTGSGRGLLLEEALQQAAKSTDLVTCDDVMMSVRTRLLCHQEYTVQAVSHTWQDVETEASRRNCLQHCGAGGRLDGSGIQSPQVQEPLRHCRGLCGTARQLWRRPAFPNDRTSAQPALYDQDVFNPVPRTGETLMNLQSASPRGLLCDGAVISRTASC